ncbi:MAG: glycogen-binding domain-containing protein [Candidatus Omnitrophica bacterium]|nr:glycogen-binding domain-containing protein [Candidatus Omnitrophota bacterium]MDD5429355.1 glycogen-binding domain-containing protein [Candidatus Omnitrophota bacterium]
MQKARKSCLVKKVKAKGKKVKFTIDVPAAGKVMLAGDFNAWKASSTPLRKNRKKVWEKELVLGPGRYEYKFVVDGNWMSDPNNQDRVQNSYGTENSVVEIA